MRRRQARGRRADGGDRRVSGRTRHSRDGPYRPDAAVDQHARLVSRPEPLARKITEAIAIPTIGIGASAACDGQVLVLEDMLGLSARTPKFVRRYGDLGPMIEAAIEGYATDVRSRAFPGPEHVYGMKAKS